MWYGGSTRFLHPACADIYPFIIHTSICTGLMDLDHHRFQRDEAQGSQQWWLLAIVFGMHVQNRYIFHRLHAMTPHITKASYEEFPICGSLSGVLAWRRGAAESTLLDEWWIPDIRCDLYTAGDKYISICSEVDKSVTYVIFVQQSSIAWVTIIHVRYILSTYRSNCVPSWILFICVRTKAVLKHHWYAIMPLP